MPRPKRPQTLEESLALISRQILKNEQEHESLLEQQKQLQAQKDLQDFNTLQAALTAKGMTIQDLLSQISSSFYDMQLFGYSLMVVFCPSFSSCLVAYDKTGCCFVHSWNIKRRKENGQSILLINYDDRLYRNPDSGS